MNEDKDRYETALFIVPSDGSAGPGPLTTGPYDTSPRWSPDGQRLAFVRALEADGKPQPAQIYVMPMDGGEPRAVTDLPKGSALGPGRSDDGLHLDDDTR